MDFTLKPLLVCLLVLPAHALLIEGTMDLSPGSSTLQDFKGTLSNPSTFPDGSGIKTSITPPVWCSSPGYTERKFDGSDASISLTILIQTATGTNSGDIMTGGSVRGGTNRPNIILSASPYAYHQCTGGKAVLPGTYSLDLGEAVITYQGAVLYQEPLSVVIHVTGVPCTLSFRDVNLGDVYTHSLPGNMIAISSGMRCAWSNDTYPVTASMDAVTSPSGLIQNSLQNGAAGVGVKLYLGGSPYTVGNPISGTGSDLLNGLTARLEHEAGETVTGGGFEANATITLSYN